MAYTIYDKYDVAMAKEMQQGSGEIIEEIISYLVTRKWLDQGSLEKQLIELTMYMSYVIKHLNEEMKLSDNMFFAEEVSKELSETLKMSVQRKKDIYLKQIEVRVKKFIDKMKIDEDSISLTGIESDFDKMISKNMRDEIQVMVNGLVERLTSMSFLDKINTENKVLEIKHLMQYVIDNIQIKDDRMHLPENMYVKEKIKNENGYLQVSINRKKTKYIELAMNQVKRYVDKEF